MIDKAVRERLKEYSDRHEITFEILDNPAYDKSIVGITTDNRLIYDYHKMVKEIMKEDKCDWQTAVDFIEFNTIRDLPFHGASAPIIMYGVDNL